MSKEYLETLGSILYSELAPLARDVTCFKLQRYRENRGDKKLIVEHTRWLFKSKFIYLEFIETKN